MKLILCVVLWRTVFGVYHFDPGFQDNQLVSALSHLTTYTTVFGYDFRELPPTNQILVWSVNNVQQLNLPKIYGPESRGLIEFESSATYLIAAKKGESTLQVYYWLGSNSSLLIWQLQIIHSKMPLPENRKLIAKYAVELVFIIQDSDRDVRYYVILSREYEGYLSQSLKITLDSANVPENIAVFVHNNLPLKRKNLYYVKGNGVDARIKKVPVHSRYMQDTSCLVLEIQDIMHPLYPVSVYCGKQAGERAREDAIYLEHYIRSEYSEQDRRQLLYIREGCVMLKVFRSALHDYSNSSSEYPEIDDSTDFLLGPEEFIAFRDDAVKMYAVNEDSRHQSELLQINQPVTYEDLGDENDNNIPKSFILDSASVAGILVSLHFLANKDQALNAVQIVEEMVWPMPVLVPVRVMIDDLVNIDYKINIDGFPYAPE